MNELQVFQNEEFGSVRTIEKQTPTYFGYIYIMEYGDLLKIGQSKKPYERLQALKRQCDKYADKKVGRFALSPKCTNYMKLEKQLHQIFAEYRKKETELFALSFDDAVQIINDSNIDYQDKSQEMDRKDSWFFNSVTKFAKGETNGISFIK